MPDTYSQIYLHYVFSVKYRHALIRPSFEEALYKYISGIIKGQNQTLIRINGMPDHVHILLRLRPAMAPSKLIQLVKLNSSKWINENKLCPIRFRWQIGGGIFSVDPNRVSSLIKYIDNQKIHHGHNTFEEEYINLLTANDIEFKDEYLLNFFDGLY